MAIRTAEVDTSTGALIVWDNAHKNVIGTYKHGDTVYVVLDKRTVQGQFVATSDAAGQRRYFIQPRDKSLAPIPYPTHGGWLIKWTTT